MGIFVSIPYRLNEIIARGATAGEVVRFNSL